MQIGRTIDQARGNDKIVTIESNLNTHTDTVSYYGTVNYLDDHRYDFDERFETLAAAERWFRTWSKLTTN